MEKRNLRKNLNRDNQTKKRKMNLFKKKCRYCKKRIRKEKTKLKGGKKRK